MDHIQITDDEARTIKDLLTFFLQDGTHPVDIEAAIALEARFENIDL